MLDYISHRTWTLRKKKKKSTAVSNGKKIYQNSMKIVTKYLGIKLIKKFSKMITLKQSYFVITMKQSYFVSEIYT